MRRGCLGVVVHDGIVEVEDNAAGLTAHQSQEGVAENAFAGERAHRNPEVARKNRRSWPTPLG